jgi:DUF4097 and DUF4098 domain-containing protein YvlB
MATYPTPEPVRLIVRIPSGRIEVITEDSEDTTVNIRRLGGRGSGTVGEDEVHVDFRPSRRDGAQLVVVAERGHKSWFGRDASYEVQVRTPHGAEVQAVTASADVRGTGRFGSVDVRTASGDVWVEEVAGSTHVKSASGDVRIRKAGGTLSVALVSGDLHVEAAADDLRGRSVSGGLSIESFDRGRAELDTVSGDVQVGVLPDRRVWMDLVSRSGDTSCDLDVRGGGEPAERETGADVEIVARSVSGDIRIRRAAPSSMGVA